MGTVMTYIRGRMPMNAVIYWLVKGLVFLAEIRKRFPTKRNKKRSLDNFGMNLRRKLQLIAWKREKHWVQNISITKTKYIWYINIKSILNDISYIYVYIRLPRIDFYENTRGKVKKLYLWMVLAHRLHAVDMDRWKHHWLYFWMPAYITNMFWKHSMKYWDFGMNATFANFQ